MGRYNWTVTGPGHHAGAHPGHQPDRPHRRGRSNANFTIGGGSLTVTAPNGGETWPIGSSRTIQWTSTGLTGNVKIEVSRNGGTSWALDHGKHAPTMAPSPGP